MENARGEIISIHIGQSGVRIGAAFWEMLCKEHGIDQTGNYHGSNDEQLEHIRVFFNKTVGRRFIPRAVVVDLEPSSMDRLRATPYGLLFRPDNFIFGQTGSGNNWAKGYYTEGADLIDSVLDVIRKEAEDCDNLQGFVVTHSIGGGTGSGMGSLLIEKIREEYQDRMIATFSILPSARVSDTVVEPYNAVLSLDRLINTANLVFCLDNEALFGIAHDRLKIPRPTNADLNALIVDAMSGITAPLRLPTQQANDFATLQGMFEKLVPDVDTYSGLCHFLTVGLSPLRASGISQPNLTAREAAQQVTDTSNMLTNSSSPSKDYAAVAIFRGQETLPIQASDYIPLLQERMSGDLNVLRIAMPPTNLQTAATLIKNDTCVREMLQRIATQFDAAFRHKAFLHWYVGEGMDEMEFEEARTALDDLMLVYQRYIFK